MKNLRRVHQKQFSLITLGYAFNCYASSRRPSWHPLRLCVKFGSQGDEIGTENLFQPSMQTGSFDVILEKRILRAEENENPSSVVFICVKHLV